MAKFKTYKANESSKIKASSSYDSDTILRKEISRNAALNTINSYNERIGNYEWMSEEDRNTYRSALDTYINSTNYLRGVNKKYGKGYTAEEDKAWEDIVTSMNTGYSQLADHYSPFTSADAYNLYYADAKNNSEEATQKYQYYLDYDLEAASADIDNLNYYLHSYLPDLEARIIELDKEKKVLEPNKDKGGHPTRRYNEVVAEYDELMAEYASILDQYGKSKDGIQKAIDEKQREYNYAKKFQFNHSLAMVSDSSSENYDPNFLSYSEKGGNISWQNVGTSEMGSRSNAGMPNVYKIPDDLKAAALVMNEKLGGTEIYNEGMLDMLQTDLSTAMYYDSANHDKINLYRKMTTAQAQTLAYYLAKDAEDGTNLAQSYVDAIYDELAAKRGAEIAAEQDTLIEKYLFAFEQGLSSFFSGIGNIFAGEEDIKVGVNEYASDYINKSLANVGIPMWYNFAEGKWEDTIAGRSTGQMFYEAVNSMGNMMPSILISFIPYVGTALGAISMGASAAGNAKLEMLRQGYSEGEATAYGLMVGASEGALQYFLGGISKLGGKVSGGAVNKLVGKIDKALARVAVSVGGSMISEGLEEAIQTALEPFFKSLATGEDFEGAGWDEMLYSAIIGAVTAFGMEGGPSVVGTTVNSIKTGKKYGSQAPSIVSNALQINPENTHAQRMQSRLDSGKKVSGYQINRLTSDTFDSVKSQAKARFTELGESKINADKLSTAVAKATMGMKLTSSDLDAMKNSKHTESVLVDFLGKVGTNEDTNTPKVETTTEDKTTAEVETSASEGGEITIEKDGNTIEVKPQRITSIENGEMSVELEGGEVVEVSDVDFGDNGIGLVYQAAVDMSSRVGGFNVDTANVFVKGYNPESGQSAGAYIDGWISAYKFGAMKNPPPLSALAANPKTAQLTEEQRKNAYNFGRAFGNEKVATNKKSEGFVGEYTKRSYNSEQAELLSALPTEALQNAMDSNGAVSFNAIGLGGDTATQQKWIDAGLTYTEDGKTYVDENAVLDERDRRRNALKQEKIVSTESKNAEKISKTDSKKKKGRVIFDGEKYGKTLNPRQRASLKALNFIAKALGIDIYVDKLAKGDNGWYDPKDRSIHIDLYAGVEAEALMLFAAAHELTHDIRATLPEKFNMLADAIFEEYTKKYDDHVMEDLVNAKIDFLKEKGDITEDMTEEEAYDLAYEEVICDCCETLLADSDAMKSLSKNIYAKDKGLWNAIKRFFVNLVERIKAAYKDVIPDTEEGQRFRDLGNGAERIKNLWAEAIVELSEVGSEGREGEVKHSYSSIAYSFFGDKAVKVKDFENGSYTETEGYKRYVENCLNNMRQTSDNFDEESARKEIEDSIAGIVKVAVAMKKAGYDILDNHAKRSTVDSKNRLLFSSLEPNSDYFTSSDISTICDKRINFAEIYDEIVRREEALGVPKGKRFFDNVDNYFILHKIMANKGLTQPCRQCYVESMRKNLAPMANAFLKLMQETDPNNKANDQLWNKGQPKPNNTKLRENLLEVIETEEYDITADKLTVEMLTTEDGLAQLKLQAPLIYEAFNSFYGQSKPKMPKSATPFRFGELTALLTDNKGKIKKSLIDKIVSTGGFRLQSYSDFQIQNFADVLQVIFEAGTLGLNGHAYTKVPAFLDATKGTNLKRNISIFMYNDNGQWKIDRNDSFPYDLEKIYDIVKSDKQGNTTIIAVSQNEMMSAWIMANDNVGYFIPFHKSGMKMGTVRETVVKEDGREIKGYSGIKDHTRQQTEVWAKNTADHKANTKVKKGINIYEFWDFDNVDNLSREGLIEKNVRAYIDACIEAGYLPKFREYVMNNSKVLNSVLSYAKELGFVSQNATIDDISFEYKGYRIPYGYYKCLGDFGMFTPSGEASPIERLSLKDYNFDEATAFFSDAETLRRNEILQQIANGEERARYRNSDMTTAEIAEEVQAKRNKVVDEVVSGEYKKSRKEASKLRESDLVKLLKDVKAKKLADGTYIPVRINTPQILISFAKEYGYTLENLPLAMRVYKARQAISSVEEWDGDVKDTPHNLTPKEIIEIIRAMDNPSYLVYQTKNDRFAEIVKFDMGKEKAYAIIDFSDVHKNADIMNGYKGGKYNILVTVYPSDDVQELKDYLKNKSNKVMTEEEMKKKGFSQRGLGSYVPAHLNESPFFEDSIPQYPNSVKREISDRDTAYMDAVNPEKSDIRYQHRATNGMKPRTLLANALESAAQNDIERNKLKQYKKKIDLLHAEEEKLHNLNEQIKELSFKKGPRDTEAIKSLQFEANQTANRINTYDRQLFNLESTKALKGVLEREKAQARKRAEQKAEQRRKDDIAKVKERAAKTERELMTRYQESRKKATESRNKTAMRHKIKEIASELNTLLLRPTAKKHIKEELRKEVANALSAINMDTVDADARVAYYNDLIARQKDPDVIAELTKTRDNIQTQGDNLQDKLNKLQSAYEKIKNTDDIELNLAYQEVIQNSIKAVSEKVGKTSIRNMTLEQLEMVYDLFSMIRKTIRDANKSFKEQKGLTITQIAEAVNDQVRTIAGQPYKRNVIVAALQRIGWTLLKPYVAFRTIGSDTFTNMYKELRNGEDTFYGDVKEAQAFIEEQYKKHGYKSWDMKKTKTFTAKSGKTFDLTLEQMMSLYAYSRREQAHDHIIEGGIVLEDALVVEKNKLGIPMKYEVTTKDAFNLSEETFAEITNSLTAEQKAFVDEMQAYLSDVMGAKGNEVSMELLGVKLFKEKFYLPIKSSQYYMNFKAEEAGEVKLRSPAFSKETVTHANNPIVLHNFTDLWAEHINDMSMYHSFVLALEDFTRVYNYKTRTDAKVETMDIKATLETAYPGVTRYINKFLKDMNGGIRAETVGWAEKLTSLSKKGAVLGSASVVIQQPSAVMRAMAVISPKYFITTAHKSLNLVKHRQDWAELKKYAPIAGIKEMGRFDVGMGQQTVDWIQSNKTLLEKGEDILSAAPAFMDEITWVSIWNAVKRETAHNNPTLKTSSEEFLKIAGERFTDVISLTQVYDSVFSRSDLMRNKSWIAKAVTAFMAEPTTTLNMLWDAWIQAKRSGSVKGFVAITSKTTGAVLSAIVLNSALKAIVAAMRDDDEDESYAEKYIEHFVGDLGDNLNPLTLIPVVKDVVSIFNGYDVDRMDMALINDLKSAIDAFDSDSKSDYEKWSGLASAISAFFGIPVKNVERDIRAVINTFFGDTEATTEMGIFNAIEEGWTGEKKSDNQMLYEAYMADDVAQKNRISARYEDEKAINAALRQAIREYDPRVKTEVMARLSKDFTTANSIRKEVADEGHFAKKIVIDAFTAEYDYVFDKIKEAKAYIKDAKPEKAEEIYKALDKRGYDIDQLKKI